MYSSEKRYGRQCPVSRNKRIPHEPPLSPLFSCGFSTWRRVGPGDTISPDCLLTLNATVWGSIAMRLPNRRGAPVSFTISAATDWNAFARSQLTLDSASGEVVRLPASRASAVCSSCVPASRSPADGCSGGVCGRSLQANGHARPWPRCRQDRTFHRAPDKRRASLHRAGRKVIRPEAAFRSRLATRCAAEFRHRTRHAVKTSGQPFSSTDDTAANGVTVTTTAASASTTSTSTLKFSLPSFVVCARVSMVLLAVCTMYWNWNRRSSARTGSGVDVALIQIPCFARWVRLESGVSVPEEPILSQSVV
jgi:hypothetical protein